MKLEKIFIAGVGVSNPLGDSAQALARFVNAGINAVQVTSAVNKSYNTIKMAKVPEKLIPPLNPKLWEARLPSWQERLVRLAGSALLGIKPMVQQLQSIPIVLALPEIFPARARPWKGNVIEQISIQSELDFDLQVSLAAEIGRAGGLHAIKHVFELLEAGHDMVVLGGMDTYWDLGRLAYLDHEDRLLVEGSIDGFPIGEGACFVVFTHQRLLSHSNAPQIAIYKPGNAEEIGHRYSDQPYRGDGLANATRTAISHAPITPINGVWTSMIYDNFGNKEFGVAMTRNNSHLSPHVKFRHPVDCFGDLGAAIGSTLIALIFGNVTDGKNIGRSHLICCSSDNAYRSAVRLEIQ